MKTLAIFPNFFFFSIRAWKLFLKGSFPWDPLEQWVKMEPCKLTATRRRNPVLIRLPSSVRPGRLFDSLWVCYLSGQQLRGPDPAPRRSLDPHRASPAQAGDPAFALAPPGLCRWFWTGTNTLSPGPGKGVARLQVPGKSELNCPFFLCAQNPCGSEPGRRRPGEGTEDPQDPPGLRSRLSAALRGACSGTAAPSPTAMPEHRPLSIYDSVCGLCDMNQ